MWKLILRNVKICGTCFDCVILMRVSTNKQIVSPHLLWWWELKVVKFKKYFIFGGPSE